jgi:hypothetical protein
MPVATTEYQIGQLYCISELSKEGSDKGGEGVEVIANEPFDDEKNGKGQYTHKIYHVGASLPSFISYIVPSKMLDVHEESWNSYPYCKTVITCPFLGDRFNITIQSSYRDNDVGNSANVFNLSKAELSKRKIVKVDIVNDDFEEYKKEDDPKLCKSIETGRGPINGKDWETKQPVIMCCYKLVTVECRIWGLQNKIESKFQEFERGIFLKLHRRIFCSLDKWINMTMEEVREHEKKVEKELKMLFEPEKKPKQKKGKNDVGTSSSIEGEVEPTTVSA